MAEVYLLENGYKIEKISTTGPSADVTVTAGAASNVTISISPSIKAKEVIGVAKIDGVPDGVVLARVVPSTSQVVLRLFNPTASDVTVSAGSITIEVFVLGY